jgi:hypothetical protein
MEQRADHCSSSSNLSKSLVNSTVTNDAWSEAYPSREIPSNVRLSCLGDDGEGVEAFCDGEGDRSGYELFLRCLHFSRSEFRRAGDVNPLIVGLTKIHGTNRKKCSAAETELQPAHQPADRSNW